MNNRIFFQHPDLMRLLNVHKDIMSIMMNILTAQQGTVEHSEHENGEEVTSVQPVKVRTDSLHKFSSFSVFGRP